MTVLITLILAPVVLWAAWRAVLALFVRWLVWVSRRDAARELREERRLQEEQRLRGLRLP